MSMSKAMAYTRPSGIGGMLARDRSLVFGDGGVSSAVIGRPRLGGSSQSTTPAPDLPPSFHCEHHVARADVSGRVADPQHQHVRPRLERFGREAEGLFLRVEQPVLGEEALP